MLWLFAYRLLSYVMYFSLAKGTENIVFVAHHATRTAYGTHEQIYRLHYVLRVVHRSVGWKSQRIWNVVQKQRMEKDKAIVYD